MKSCAWFRGHSIDNPDGTQTLIKVLSPRCKQKGCTGIFAQAKDDIEIEKWCGEYVLNRTYKDLDDLNKSITDSIEKDRKKLERSD